MAVCRARGRAATAGCGSAPLQGVAVVDPAHIPVNTIVPPVWIERVKFDSRTIALQNGIRLGPGAGNLEVWFQRAQFRVAAAENASATG